MPGQPTPSNTIPAISAAERRGILSQLLKGVSRSFYLTLRVLPKGIREPVGLAYLLARAADTIADTTLLPQANRLKHLLDFRAQVVGPADAGVLRLIGESLTDLQAIGKEAELLRSLPSVFAVLEELAPDDRQATRSVVVELTKGMETDLRTFPSEDSGEIIAIKDAQALDDYVYQVAGCVGEFWTAIMVAHTPPLRGWDVDEMSSLGVRFGKALQMTNVLRDVPKDLRMGRCYITSKELTRLDLKPTDLLDVSKSLEARPALVDGIRLALDHYAAAEQYILSIPRSHLRLRLAALWPVIIGLGTLAETASNWTWLDPDSPSRVSRGWVYRIMVFSLLVGRSNGLLRWWIRRLRNRIESAL